MIWYTIIATVFLFKYGYVASSENVLSVTNTAKLESHKYISTIYRYNQANNVSTFICIGVLVGSHYVITPASCVSGFDSPDEMYVHVNTLIIGMGERYKVIGITFDPRTNGPRTNIAILKLARRLKKSGTIGAINMPKEDRAVPGSIVSVISYGVPPVGSRTPTLQKTTATILQVQHTPLNSFVVSNLEEDRIIFSNPDHGAPAVKDKCVLGLLSSRTGWPNPKATFVNLFKLKNFVTAHTRGRWH